MSTYVKITDYAAKDALLTGNPSKLIKGTELGAEFDSIASADASNVKTATLALSSGASLSGYIGELSGSTARTVQAKLRETISARDLGDSDGIGNITLNVPADYATLEAAMVFLRTKTIVPGTTVIISIAAGTHDYTGAAVSLNHPQGSQISIVGAGSGSTILTWTNTSTGIDALTVTNGHVLGSIDALTITRTAHAGTSISTGLLADNGSVIICGSDIKVTNHYYGIAARYGSYIKCDSAEVDGAGDVGIWAFVGSAIDCSSATANNCADPLQSLGFGIQAEYCSTVNCDSASASGNKVGGIAALSGSTVRAHSATASSNTAAGFVSRDNSIIECHGATASSNGTYGVLQYTSGVVYYTSITMSGNGTGNKSPSFEIDNTTLGARAIASSGSLRLDTVDTSSVYFNTSGGLQFEVAHAASAVNNVRAKGSAAGAGVILDANGSDTNIDMTLKGAGTGSVFLGSSQANYVRVNGATAGNVPAIYAEGSDPDVTLFLSGKNAGVVQVPTSSTTRASLRIPHGSAPTSPVNGDIWTTTAGLFVRINGATVGPLT